MNFAFSDEQQALRDQARKFLSDRAAPARVRRILESDEPFDRELWRGMGELAWTGTAIPESYGGAGFGYLELCVLAEELGRSLAPTPFSSSVYLATEALLLAGSAEQKQRWLPRLALGEAIGCLALAEGPRAPHPGNIETVARNGRVTGAKLPVADGDVADFAIVAARPDGADANAVSLSLVALDGAGITRTRVDTVDPTRSHARLTFDGAAAEPLGQPGAGWALVERLLDRAAVLFAFEQVGGAQAALDMARDYALGRFAFGRPIGSFQAIKHKLADVYVALELARSNAYYGAWALATNAPTLPVAAAAARVAASEAFYLAAKENIQTHGGMGFTWEFDCHMYYRRAKLLALAIGSTPRWKDKLITRLEQGEAQPQASRAET
jgi:acyl-CoA dehydrogenase